MRVRIIVWAEGSIIGCRELIQVVSKWKKPTIGVIQPNYREYPDTRNIANSDEKILPVVQRV